MLKNAKLKMFHVKQKIAGKGLILQKSLCIIASIVG